MAEMSEDYSLVIKFIKKNHLGALATVNKKGQPDVAVIYCSIKDDLSLYFSTRVEAAKFQNISNNPAVAITFYDAKSVSTVQIRGRAKRLEDLKAEQDIMLELVKQFYSQGGKMPPFQQLFENFDSNELAIVKIKPTDVSYSSFKQTRLSKAKPVHKKIL